MKGWGEIEINLYGKKWEKERLKYGECKGRAVNWKKNVMKWRLEYYKSLWKEVRRKLGSYS